MLVYCSGSAAVTHASNAVFTERSDERFYRE